ncbi:MAG: M23 family metallopeptidase [Chitinophagaceae bacterium]|jgi:murein DD-endopeptidase MepM/ murein hydrolase activator NlpD|nr:M23 family metallopeptidase [Chitinophagaceae bacterium]
MKSWIPIIYITIIAFIGCRSPGIDIFGKKTPHNKYEQKLKDAGLNESALGKAWLYMADWSLQNPVIIQLPFREAGYFSGDKAHASGYVFNAQRGEFINVTLDKKPLKDFDVFLDLWKLSRDSIPGNLTYADTTHFNFEVEEDGAYILRLQPELLRNGNYTLTITTGPSLAYPVQAPGKESIQSFWGASRDGGNRFHEGVDIFAARYTPVTAAADGRISRVNVNNLGGKVIFMRLKDRNISLYYAHLDSQLVHIGQSVKAGDTIGLLGNSGNAITTAPHLHFGIYTSGGAIDPLPFIKPSNKEPANITSPLDKLGNFAKTGSRSINTSWNGKPLTILPNTYVYIQGAASNEYKVVLPDSISIFINNSMISGLNPIRKIKVSADTNIYDQPNLQAFQKGKIFNGDEVDVIAGYNDFFYIKNTDGLEGWLKH